jgi:hypothetical protein
MMTVSKTERERIYRKYKAMKEKAESKYEKDLHRIDTLHGREITRAVKKASKK